jgi:hypothetical protein
MAKLKNIIKQLSDKDYQEIYTSLMESNADKSAFLLKQLREKQLSDTKIMEDLGVNTNAYYTLRSRLNQKIEEYLLQQMESPRTDLLKKVANINEVIFTKKKAISLATLKKLEKELIDYDLSNELTLVYKALKKLHVNSPDSYNFSQAYNKNVAYMLAVDKAEDLLAEYFKKFGVFTFTGDEVDRLGLTLLNNEINNTEKLYQTHRLYVYKCCVNIFHRLFVEADDQSAGSEDEPIEDMLNKVQKIFTTYQSDSIYYHLRIVFEFLRLEYYTHYKVYRKAEKYFEDLNESTAALLTNFAWFTFPAQFLHTKIERAMRLDLTNDMHEENKLLFEEFETDVEDLPNYVNYIMYRALCYHFAGKYEQAAKWINNLLNEISLKKYPYVLLEIKAILALEYCLMKDFELHQQLINSIQRQIRILGKDDADHIIYFIKILKTALNEGKKEKKAKIKAYADRIPSHHRKLFSPTKYIKFDEKLLNLLADL